MNLLLLLATVAAIASIVQILKSSLRWEAILGFGILIAVSAGIALLLDYLTPITNFEWAGEQTVTGLPLYLPGPSDSILGKGYGFFFIAFCWGIALIIAGFVKRSKKKPLAPAVVKPATEANRIRNELEDEVESYGASLEDPRKIGMDDATRAGGPFPKESDREPSRGGYEVRVRQGFQALGDRFTQNTVNNLMAKIGDALTNLSNIREDIVRQTYKEIARASYNEKGTEISPIVVQKNQSVYTTTTQARKVFIDSLELRKAEQPNWADNDRTTREKLVVWGIAFALIEFAISWFFLKSQIGESAVQIAAYAVVIIFILSFLAGFLFRFMRHSQLPHIRLPAIIVFLCVCFFIFLAFGLLLNFREVTASADVAGRFDAILSGYESLTVNLTNVVVFLVNLIALAVFYWKVLHFFDKFNGYSQVDGPFRRAEKRWDDMSEKSQEKIADALDDTNNKAIANSEVAKKYFDDIQKKVEVLTDIKGIISNAYASILRPAYQEYVREYRASNCANRALQVNPAPGYFDDEASFCEVDQHFPEFESIEKFLAEKQGDLEQAEKYIGEIDQAKAKWQTDRPALRAELTSEFATIIAAARRTGSATGAVSPQSDEQQETTQ
ncbi:hypothetical protein [Candidatus Spongiihabitans sp.]|uniref:hypothetical protein n=1 Tax=Candidatus Spongiihabitans sp. TaxID=3101308 RepID=UPI003C6F067E